MTKLAQFLKDERGTATIEFLLVFPTIFLIFTASFESSLYMAKYVMFERSIDLVMREVRLGNATGMTHQLLKESICKSGMLVRSKADCLSRMRLWMQPVNTANFDIQLPDTVCVEKASEVNDEEPPANEFAYGVDNDIMLLRVCMKERPIFPTTAVSVKMPREDDGSVAMIVTTVFVNEPG
jgi:hypothetical protein